MSGGVDSSVAAKLLTDMGYSCTGCTMKLYNNEDIGIPRSHACCSLDDVDDARSVAYKLDMPYYVFNFSRDFKEKIIDRFAAGYLSGITPNPCIDCNRYMKFDKLYERADILGCRFVATGHYAKIRQRDGLYLLEKADDLSKDQSYVLYNMTQEKLSRTLFPLGGLLKSQVRDIAEACGFVNSHKPDSQDICFAPDGDYAKAIERHTGKVPEPGDFTDTSGRVLGRHDGIIHYTVGQHRGLGLSLPDKKFVCGICPEDNTVILGDESDLFRRDAFVEDFNWIQGATPKGAIRCKAKIRYRQTEQSAEVTPIAGDKIHIRFDEPQRAVTPGQAAVLYDGSTVIGGGRISASRP